MIHVYRDWPVMEDILNERIDWHLWNILNIRILAMVLVRHVLVLVIVLRIGFISVVVVEGYAE